MGRERNANKGGEKLITGKVIYIKKINKERVLTTNDTVSTKVIVVAKERFNVMGKELTANEKAVYEFVRDNGVVDYKMVAEKLNISPKSASSTLARLEATHSLLKKNAPKVATTYEVEAEADEAEAE